MTDCVHRYRLTEPDGPTVIGECVLCGHLREYNTSYREPEGRQPLRGSRKDRK